MAEGFIIMTHFNDDSSPTKNALKIESERPRLLVVDDQPINAHALHALFSETCDVYVATSGEQAIAKCELIHPDLILLDVIMPGIDGWETCYRLKKNSDTAHIPIIFVTGQLDETDELKGFSLGAVDFIRKPIHPVITQIRVETHLRLKRQSDLLRKMALVDGLTGVANRRSFEAQLKINWLQSIRAQDSIAVLMIDVDWFKLLNDTHGHQYGDDCLKRVAQALADALNRPCDTVSRYGGEEFVILLPQTDYLGAEEVARRVFTKIEELNFPHSASPLHRVSVSCGIAAIKPEIKATPQLLVERADQALYQAKNAGRNCWRTI